MPFFSFFLFFFLQWIMTLKPSLPSSQSVPRRCGLSCSCTASLRLTACLRCLWYYIARYVNQALSTNRQIYLSLNSRSSESFSPLTMWLFGYHVNSASSTAGLEKKWFFGPFPLACLLAPPRYWPPNRQSMALQQASGSWLIARRAVAAVGFFTHSISML